MLVKNVIIIVQRTMFANQKNVQLVVVIRMLIGLTDIFASHTRQARQGQKVRKKNDRERGIRKVDRYRNREKC